MVRNELKSKQNGRHYADDIYKLIFSNENYRISIRMLHNFAEFNIVLYWAVFYLPPTDITVSNIVLYCTVL